MIKRYFILLMFFQFTFAVIGQDKIYFDSEWNICNRLDASYYRVMKLNDLGKPIGTVKDYYITGELQMEGYFSSINNYDESKSVHDGICEWYYKSGVKYRESNYSNNLEVGKSTYWDEKGRITYEQYFDLGVLNYTSAYYYYDNGNLGSVLGFKDKERHGKCYFYNENGKLSCVENYEAGKLHGLIMWYNDQEKIQTIKEYSYGEPVNKFYITFDDYNKTASRKFRENFSSDNSNEWFTKYDLNSVSAKYVKDQGLLFKVKENTFRNTVQLPLDKVNDYTIKAKVEYVSGQINNGYGIVWGMKDWDNYNYFVVSPNGYYMIGSKWDGISSQSEWKYSKSVSQKQNNLTIKKLGDKIYYAINGTVVESDDYVLLHGAEIGLYNTASKTVRLKSLEVDQEFTLNDLEKLLDKYTESNSNSSTESSSTVSDWMGNGTGFFIDRTGYIATNYHVVDGAKDIEVEFIRNGVKQVYSAEVIQSDKHNDLSILKINSPSFKPFDYIPYNFKLAISEVGSNVFALGYPMALSLMGTEIKFTDGKISSKTGMQGDITTYQISVPIQPGNSGGPLFDYDGNLVGITSSSINRGLDITENVNYAIKTSYLKSLIEILPVGLNLPSYNSISNKTLTEKIKVISDYVVLIKVR